MVAPVAKKSSPIIVTSQEPKAQQTSPITAQRPSGLNTVNGLSDRAQQTCAAKPAPPHSARQKIMATLAREAEHKINKSHLRKPDTEKRLTRQAIP